MCMSLYKDSYTWITDVVSLSNVTLNYNTVKSESD